MPAFAFGVPVDINAFHRYTNCSSIPSNLLATQYPCQTKVKPWSLSKRLRKPPTHALRPVNPDNACLPRITETSGHDLSLFLTTVVTLDYIFTLIRIRGLTYSLWGSPD